jgi:dienelactone hydrolase
VVALHSHDGYKWYGKEKVADGPEGPLPALAALRAQSYGDRPFANELARRGFAVLAHDVFLWGSRRFPVEAMPESVLQRVEDYVTARRAEGRTVDEIERYNVAASHHEHVVAKYSTLLGGTLAGMVAFEDRVAVSYLRSRPEVDGERIGCAGLSGGGCRAAMLQATCEAIRASVVVGMMSTYEGLLDRHVQSHTWMFFPPGLARHADWPDLTACRAPSPLLVQYLRGDGLFSIEGMEAAHRRIAGHYEGAGRPDAYTGEFYEGPHRFDREMQGAAFDWLERQL